MQNKIEFFEVNKQDKNYNKLPNVSIYFIVYFKLSSNKYSTDVFVKDFDWVTLSIGYDNFKQLIILRN